MVRSVHFFGKSGEAIAALRDVSSVPKENRKEYGQKANQVKEALTKRVEIAQSRLNIESNKLNLVGIKSSLVELGFCL